MDKLPDSEIVKALDSYKKDIGCAKCDFKDKYLFTVIENALDLINRQNEEIENLNAEVGKMVAENERLEEEIEKQYEIASDTIRAEIADGGTSCHWCEDTIRGVAKAEAYKEFVEKSEKEIFIKRDDERKQMLEILKTYRGTRAYSDTEQAIDNWLRGYGEAVQDILGVFDNLLKELVGDSK